MIDVAAITEAVYGGDVVRSLLFAAAEQPENRVVRVAMASAEPGKGGQLHHHPETDEIYFIIAGEARLHLNGEQFDLVPDNCVRIPRGSTHRIASVGTERLRYLAFHVGAADNDRPVAHVQAPATAATTDATTAAATGSADRAPADAAAPKAR
ncbi:cupin domain-containing protein [Kitasatospora sp. NPDC058170]|uniref:cupin domain-containing protein n=1 Tax=Kitasatospora sp. NPDC058170 TaxID=3346364 RepID=UPI0036DE6F7D